MQHFVEGRIRAGSGCGRQAVEVLPQSFARQEDRCDAKASLMNLGSNEVLSAVVLLRLADVSDGCLVKVAHPAGYEFFGDEYFRPDRI